MTKIRLQRAWRAPLLAAGFACCLFQALPAAYAAGKEGVSDNFLWLAVILLAANIAARSVERFRMPGVLGELLIGIVLGNLTLVGFDAFEALKQDAVIAFIAELGVVILLFQIGLESSLQQMRKVGARAFIVAVIGIVAPFLLGAFVAGPLLLPGQSFNAYLFLGATLTATSVGITGRVFQDLGRIKTREAQIVLGAAVIDDVLGLVILAVVTGLVREGSISAFGVGMLIMEAVAFLTGAIAIGRLAAPWLSGALARVHAGVAMKLTLIISVCLVMAWLAQLIGLAPIVGAFAAGLVLEPVFLSDFEDPDIVRALGPLVQDSGDARASEIRKILDHYSGHHHHHLLEPLGYFFVPIFFVYTGMQVRLASFFDVSTLLTALGVTVAALAGKFVAGYAAGQVNRAVVGWGMVPRGEVGLIFAMTGNQLGVVSEQMFSVIIIMVIITTLITPLVLMRLLRGGARQA
ncbi:MAG TPA: cation:proton antiporter [Gallionella sp.]|nr:cation:proton antiporter [Gallionella sp.]